MTQFVKLSDVQNLLDMHNAKHPVPSHMSNLVREHTIDNIKAGVNDLDTYTLNEEGFVEVPPSG